ncbi:MAG TPA: hypothetical protein PLY35_09515, partial [Thermotogota bacterium]|nr:hypothetical protein [Thermotogota bacterium]
MNEEFKSLQEVLNDVIHNNIKALKSLNVSKLQTGLEEINVAIELINEAAANPALAQFHDQ